MKPSNSPTQGQPNPRKNRLKSGIWATFFPQQIVFRGLGLVLYRKQTTRNLTQPHSAQTPCVPLWLLTLLVFFIAVFRHQKGRCCAPIASCRKNYSFARTHTNQNPRWTPKPQFPPIYSPMVTIHIWISFELRCLLFFSVACYPYLVLFVVYIFRIALLVILLCGVGGRAGGWHCLLYTSPSPRD